MIVTNVIQANSQFQDRNTNPKNSCSEDEPRNPMFHWPTAESLWAWPVSPVGVALHLAQATHAMPIHTGTSGWKPEVTEGHSKRVVHKSTGFALIFPSKVLLSSILMAAGVDQKHSPLLKWLSAKQPLPGCTYLEVGMLRCFKALFPEALSLHLPKEWFFSSHLTRLRE